MARCVPIASGTGCSWTARRVLRPFVAWHSACGAAVQGRGALNGVIGAVRRRAWQPVGSACPDASATAVLLRECKRTLVV